MIDGSLTHQFIGDQLVLAIEEQNPKLLARFMLELVSNIGEERGPAGNDWPACDFFASRANTDFAGRLDIGSDGGADADDFGKIGRASCRERV